jgi:putative inorganic carbon (HCO3(-)) transporter
VNGFDVATDHTTAWWRHPPAALSSRVLVAASAAEGQLAYGALVAFTGIMLLSPQTWVPALGPLRIALLAAAVAIGRHLLDRLSGRGPAQRTQPEILIALSLATWSAVTVPFSLWPGGSMGTLTDLFLKAIIFFWLIGALVTTEHRLRRFLWLLVVCTIPLSLTGVKNYLSGAFLATSASGVPRIFGYAGSGLTDNPNNLALMLNLLIPFAAALALTERRPAYRLVAGAAVLLSSAAVVATFSRAGFVTMATLGLIAFVTLVRKRPLAAFGAVLVLVLAVPLVPQGYRDRLSTIINIQADPTGSAQERWGDFNAAVAIVARNPIVGAGLDQNVLALNQERGAAWVQVHNVYLQYAVDLGLPGLALYLWLFASIFRTAWRARRRAAADPSLHDLAVVAASVQASLVAFGVAAMFHPVAYHFYFFCVAGVALAVANALGSGIQPAPAASRAAR